MHLADHDEALVGGRIWTSAEHIDQRLADLTEHMETVIQKYLATEFETIDDYNAQGGELAEPYRFLVIADLPTNFSQESVRRLASIASTGARCGVYTLITRDLRQPIPGGSGRISTRSNRTASTSRSRATGAFVWNDEVFKRSPSRSTPAERRVSHADHGPRRQAARRRPSASRSRSRRSRRRRRNGGPAKTRRADGPRRPRRRDAAAVAQARARRRAARADRRQDRLRQIDAAARARDEHRDVVLADEVEFYLVDFKKGVEFKTYASNELPHARAIAVESTASSACPSCQRIDAELARRGELFARRRAGSRVVPPGRPTRRCRGRC
jgi:hypothetical protein